jgi:hypothetical protein
LGANAGLYGMSEVGLIRDQEHQLPSEPTKIRRRVVPMARSFPQCYGQRLTIWP